MNCPIGLPIILACWGMSVAQAAAAPAGVTVQLPTFGVAIDADGMLRVMRHDDPQGRLRAQRIAAAQQNLPVDVRAASPLRKVSLIRLEETLKAQLDTSQPPDDVLLHLAGLQRLRYLFFFPDQRDIVIAGPAEGWAPDPSGRIVGIQSGRPTLLLADLAVALRAYPPGSDHRPFVGCTIDPPREGLARLRAFQASIPKVIPAAQRRAAAAAIAHGAGKSLGMADIRVFGVAPQTHFAQVLVEADYRMKLIGMGLEPPPVRMATFIGALNSPRQAILQRWWFAPHEQCARATPDGLALELVGEGVRLLAEDKFFDIQGKLTDAPAPNKASEQFVSSFTENYQQIAVRSPVYAQMRNMIDLAIAAAYLRREDFYGQAGWTADLLRDETALATQTLPAPKQTPCVANALWKGSRLLAPAGGGVSIQADQLIEKDRLFADDGALAQARKTLELPPNRADWWWD